MGEFAAVPVQCLIYMCIEGLWPMPEPIYSTYFSALVTSKLVAMASDLIAMASNLLASC